MKMLLPLLAICAAACSTADVPRHRVGDDLEISLNKQVSEARPILVVKIVNRSSKSVCIRAAALDDPYSGEMTIRLRDLKGRTIKVRERGIAPPAREGTTRLDPQNGHAQGRYFLDSRFKAPPKQKDFRRRMTAQVSFRYGYCDDVWSLQATSSWQPI